MMPIMKAMMMGINKVKKMVGLATVTVLIMMIQVIIMTKVSHPYFMGTLGLKCFVIAHKYKKLTLT